VRPHGYSTVKCDGVSLGSLDGGTPTAHVTTTPTELALTRRLLKAKSIASKPHFGVLPCWDAVITPLLVGPPKGRHCLHRLPDAAEGSLLQRCLPIALLGPLVELLEDWPELVNWLYLPATYATPSNISPDVDDCDSFNTVHRHMVC